MKDVSIILIGISVPLLMVSAAIFLVRILLNDQDNRLLNFLGGISWVLAAVGAILLTTGLVIYR